LAVIFEVAQPSARENPLNSAYLSPISDTPDAELEKTV
jgi:hypothetical protein